MPAVLFVGLLIAYPLFVAVELSLTPGRFATLDTTATGLSLEHFGAVFTQPDTLRQLLLTAVYVVGTLGPAFLLGLVVALLLRNPFPGRRWLRSLILLPWAVPGVAASAIFLWMLDGSFGVLNKILSALNIIDYPIAWYSNPRTAMAAVIFPTVWKLFPFFAMILLASLQTVPNELYESARVDGAGAWMRYRAVTWPGIRGAGYAALLIGGLGVYREFDFIYPLTRGGPEDVTTTLAISIYREAFQFSNMGFASALGIVSTLIAAVFVVFGGRAMAKVND
jgi:multiple sugar transport system permease protein